MGNFFPIYRTKVYVIQQSCLLSSLVFYVVHNKEIFVSIGYEKYYCQNVLEKMSFL